MSKADEIIKNKSNELKKQYEIELDKNSIKAFILKCQIDILEEILVNVEKVEG